MPDLYLVDDLVRAVEAENRGRLADTQSSPNTEAMGDMNRDEVKARLEASEARVEKSMAELRSDVSTMKNEIMSALAGFRADSAKGWGDIRTDFAKAVGDVRTDHANSRSDIRSEHAKERSTAHRWQVTTILSVLAVAIAAIVAVYNLKLKDAYGKDPAPKSQQVAPAPQAKPLAPTP